MRRRGRAVQLLATAIATRHPSHSLFAQNDPPHLRLVAPFFKSHVARSRRKVTSVANTGATRKSTIIWTARALSSPSQHRWSKETPRALYDGTNVLGTCHTSRSPGILNKPIWIISEYNGRNEKCACAEEPDLAIASLQSDLPSFLPSRRKNH
jgi:hypothetical protein